MTARQRRLIMLGGLAFLGLLFVIIAFIGLSNLSSKSQHLVDLKVEDNKLEAQLNNLAEAKKEISQYNYFRAIVRSVIPNDKDQVQAVADVLQFASQSGNTIQGITFPPSTLRSKLPAVGGTSGSSATAPGAAHTAITQAKPVAGIPGLYSVELTITHTADASTPAAGQSTYPELLDFLNRIEQNRRTAQISQVNITPILDNNGTPTPYINFVIITNIFMKP